MEDALTHAKFHVVKEYPNYDMVLGRSWIHDNKTKLGVCPLPVSIPERVSNKPSNPEDYLLPYQQLANVTQLPEENVSAYVRIFLTQLSLIEQTFFATSHSSSRQGLGTRSGY